MVLILLSPACTSEQGPSPSELVRFSDCDELRATVKEPSPPERAAYNPLEQRPVAQPHDGDFVPLGGPADVVTLGPMGRDPAEPAHRKITRDVRVDVHGPYGDANHGDFVVQQGAELRVSHRTGTRRGKTDVVALPGFPLRGERLRAEDPRASAGVGGVLVHDDVALVLTGGRDGSVPAPVTSSSTSILVYDISDAPTRRATISFDGSVLSARIIDARLRIVSSTARRAPLPQYRIRSDGEDDTGPLVECGATWAGRRRRGSQLISITMFGLGASPPSSIASFLASPVGVAASNGSVLLATDAPTDDTFVYRFAAGRAPASFRARGRLLAGWGDEPLNRWALSEHDGHVRVVTRDPAPDDPSELPELQRTIVSVGRIEGDELPRVAQVVKESPAGKILGIRLLGGIGVIEPHRPEDRTSVEIIDLDRHRLAGRLDVPPGETAYLALEDGLLLTKSGARAPYTYTVFDLRDPERPKVVESIRSRTRFWSHAVDLLHVRVSPLEGMPDDI